VSYTCDIRGTEGTFQLGFCYDCAVLCKLCDDGPAHPNTSICHDCMLQNLTKGEEDENSTIQ
jgi:hypothetical protein